MYEFLVVGITGRENTSWWCSLVINFLDELEESSSPLESFAFFLLVRSHCIKSFPCPLSWWYTTEWLHHRRLVRNVSNKWENLRLVPIPISLWDCWFSWTVWDIFQLYNIIMMSVYKLYYKSLFKNDFSNSLMIPLTGGNIELFYVALRH